MRVEGAVAERARGSSVGNASKSSRRVAPCPGNETEAVFFVSCCFRPRRGRTLLGVLLGRTCRSGVQRSGQAGVCQGLKGMIAFCPREAGKKSPSFSMCMR